MIQQPQPEAMFTGRSKMILPEQYQPTNDVVIIGRGKKIREHAGNQGFYAVVDANLPAYQNAATKGLKSSILWNILTQVRSQSQHGYGFVKKEGGRWYAVDDACARINIAQAFRDRLSYAYKSSKQHKSIKRKHDLGLLPKPSTSSSAQSSPSSSRAPSPEQSNPDIGLFSSPAMTFSSFANTEERPTKRICTVSPTSTIFTTSDNKNNSNSDDDQLGIYDLLKTAINVTFDEEPATTHKPEQPQQCPDDIFSSLWNKFGSVDTTENPFEPKPIVEQQEKPQPIMPVKEISSSSNFVKTSMPRLTASSILQRTTFPMSTVQKKTPSFQPASLDSSLFDIDDDLLGDCIDMVNSLWGN